MNYSIAMVNNNNKYLQKLMCNIPLQEIMKNYSKLDNKHH